MAHILTCPLPLYQRLLRALVDAPYRSLFVRVGRHRRSPNREWLLRELLPTPPDAITNRASHYFQIGLHSDPPYTDDEEELLAPGNGYLAIGVGNERGRVWGWVNFNGRIEPITQLFLVGTGMYRLPLNSQIENNMDEPIAVNSSPVDNAEWWSRTIGALGDIAIWRRLCRLRIGIIGCGRSGSLLAASLARLGVQQLVLIDPDHIEPHNLGEMDIITSADIGRAKVSALADHLHTLVAGQSVTYTAVVAPITDPAALEMARSCDILCCCADNDAARLATAILSTLYHKVLLDIGAGIFDETHGAHNSRDMGADVRLVLPGDGCLLCRGSLGNYDQAIEELCHSHLRANQLENTIPWQQQRAGSLRSLNQIAVGVGVQMLQDLIAEHIRSSVWTAVEVGGDGRVAVRYPTLLSAREDNDCTLCRRAGLGDSGLGRH